MARTVNITSTAAAGAGSITSTTYRLLAADGTTELSTADPPYVGVSDGLLYVEQTVTQTDAQQNTVTLPIAGRVTDLAAVTFDDTQIDLTWTDVGGETAYDVHMSTSASFTANSGNRIATDLAAGSTSYSATGLTAATAYYFQVIAKTPKGATTASNEATDTTDAGGSTGYLIVISGSGRLETTSEVAALDTAILKIAAKMRFRGDVVTNVPTGGTGAGPLLLGIGNTQGSGDKFQILVLDEDASNVRFQVGDIPNGVSRSVVIARSAFSASVLYKAYAQISKTGDVAYIAVREDDGTLIGESSGGTSSGGDLSAGGYISIGGGSPYHFPGGVDGVAIYGDVVLAGAAQHSKPSTGDSGLVYLNWFDDGTGDSLTAAVGGVALVKQVGTVTHVDNTADANRWSA